MPFTFAQRAFWAAAIRAAALGGHLAPALAAATAQKGGELPLQGVDLLAHLHGLPQLRDGKFMDLEHGKWIGACG